MNKHEKYILLYPSVLVIALSLLVILGDVEGSCAHPPCDPPKPTFLDRFLCIFNNKDRYHHELCSLKALEPKNKMAATKNRENACICHN